VRVLVTGGAGFIGSHLCDRLLAEGHDVVAVDNCSTGSRDNLTRSLQSSCFRLLELDVREPLTDIDGPAPDLIYHLAAAVGVRNILEKPLESLEINLKGTEQVLAAARFWGSRVVVASTSEVYGKNDHGQLSEKSDRTIGAGDLARWWYAVAKMADEALALANHREGKLATIVVRLFNTVGPRQTGRYGMVLPTLVRQALMGEPLTVFGDGEQTRCFTYVDDTVRALAALAATPIAYGRIFNIGQSREISINELAARILAITGSRSEIVHMPYEEAYGGSFEDMRRRVPDCTLLRETLGWAPTDRLDEAIVAVASEIASQGAALCAPA
jgi:UDP-glucose 4-epimerase